ncbi:hypothetical protein L0156_10325 [bacterium]|nr:hypothetical protein [bacterium]
MTSKNNAFRVAFLISSVIMAACNNTQLSTQSVETPAVTQQPPLKIVVFQDKTASTGWTRTEQLKYEDIQPLVTLIRKHGGELAVGLVAERSNLSLVRVRTDVPLVKPVEPPKNGNVFDVAQKIGQYRKQLAEYEKIKAEKEEKEAAREKEFEEQVRKLFSLPASRKRTDIWGALRRADLFLSESDQSWKAPTEKYALFCSDGQDTAHGPKYSMKSKAKLIIVNGSASLGNMEGIDIIAFESMSAAVQHLLAQRRN